MLTACNGSASRIEETAPPPVIETVHETVEVCPAALSSPVQARPAPPPGAVIEYNGPGAGWLGAVIAWGEAGWRIVSDARDDCPESR